MTAPAGCRIRPAVSQFSAEESAVITAMMPRDQTWSEASARFDDAQLLDLVVLAGWYRGVCLVNKTLQMPLEPWAGRFPPPRAAAAG
jgi:hypothetical protein